MQRFVFIVVIVALLVTPTITYAKEYEPDKEWPEWATKRCIETIYKIVAHETGAMRDDEIFSFMTEQIIVDIQRMGCDNLTDWRWAIGEYSLNKVSDQVRTAVLKTIAEYPKTRFPRCKFIGMRADIAVWAKYGYNVTIGFERTINKLTVIGVDCAYANVQKGIKQISEYRINNFDRLDRLGLLR